MNARQAKKHLKRQIERLESDNKLMRGIIDDSPRMAELYNLYNSPCNLIHSTMNFQEYRIRRIIPGYMAVVNDCSELVRQFLVVDLAERIAKDINIQPIEICGKKAVEASIFIGRK